MKISKVESFISVALCILAMLTLVVNAQDAKPAKPKEDKADVVTLSKAQVMEIRALQAELRAAQLELENAIPQKLKDQVKGANDAVTAFWKSLGIDGTKLTEWQPVQREDGSIVLTKIKPNPPKTNEPPRPE